jgi:hypothetical protein
VLDTLATDVPHILADVDVVPPVNIRSGNEYWVLNIIFGVCPVLLVVPVKYLTTLTVAPTIPAVICGRLIVIVRDVVEPTYELISIAIIPYSGDGRLVVVVGIP